jgi:hypothetical protein
MTERIHDARALICHFEQRENLSPFRSDSRVAINCYLGHLWFSVQTSGGGGTRERPVAASTIEPSAGQYIKQTVHLGYVQRSSISSKCCAVGETTTALMLISRHTT